MVPGLGFFEAHSEAEWFAFVVFVGSPGDAERSHLQEGKTLQGEYGDKSFFAVEHVEGKSMGGVDALSPFVHPLALVVNLMAGPSERVLSRVIFQLDATILSRSDGEDEGVNLVAGFGGEFE